MYSQPFAFAQFCSRLTFGIWISDLVNAEAMTKAEAPEMGGQFCCDFKGSLDIFQCLHMIELLGSNFALNHFLWLNLSLVPWLSVFFLSILNGFLFCNSSSLRLAVTG